MSDDTLPLHIQRCNPNPHPPTRKWRSGLMARSAAATRALVNRAKSVVRHWRCRRPATSRQSAPISRSNCRTAPKETHHMTGSSPAMKSRPPGDLIATSGGASVDTRGPACWLASQPCNRRPSPRAACSGHRRDSGIAATIPRNSAFCSSPAKSPRAKLMKGSPGMCLKEPLRDRSCSLRRPPRRWNLCRLFCWNPARMGTCAD